MKRHLARLGVGLALACASFGMLLGSGTSAPRSALADEAREPDLDDELQRVLLEQELVLSERTALMLGELEERLAEWHDRGGGGS
jgi:hypothetical protein